TGQEILEELNRVPSSLAVRSRLNKFNYEIIDPVISLDERAEWEQRWSDLFLKRQAMVMSQFELVDCL
ncbi:MAG TPA: hypothetical protein VK138_03045, partial [Acidiferrobacterales bacterium]|nr:hypothetical protein [Acidiferrobacterales bacterium]